MNHPLTNEMVQDIWDKVVHEKSGRFTQDDLMRAAYDLAIKHVRAKVDAHLAELRKYPSIGERMHIAWTFETHFDRAMRLQQQEKTDNTVQDTELIQRAIRYWEDN